MAYPSYIAVYGVHTIHGAGWDAGHHMESGGPDGPVTRHGTLYCDWGEPSWIILSGYIGMYPILSGIAKGLSTDLAKSRSREMWGESCAIAMKFDRRLGSSAAEASVKLQSDTFIFSIQSGDFRTSQDLVVDFDHTSIRHIKISTIRVMTDYVYHDVEIPWNLFPNCLANIVLYWTVL